jgi:hypothetical protein
MTTIIAASALYVVVVVVVSLLLIAGSIENAAKVQQAMAQNSNSLPSTKNNNNNGGILNAGPPEKMTIAGQSKPPVLSPEKKQVLEHDQAKTHHNPQLQRSDQPILGPIPGTHAQQRFLGYFT